MIPEGTVKREGSTDILVPEIHSVHGPGKKQGSVFFNEQMSFNRDISVMFLRAVGRDLTVADAMTATGSRAVRIANEVPGTEVTANDISPDAMPYIQANIELNHLDNCRASNRNMHALFAEETFDYVDLDPFGSPVPFTQSAIRGCRRKGILAITATDTAPLAGAHAQKCRRRYQSEPVRGFMCHEGGLRILMCSIAKELAKFDRGMEPVLSFYADHYFRTYVRVVEGADAADRTLGKLGYMHYDMETLERSVSYEPDADHRLGPFWLGNLHDQAFLQSMKAEGMTEERRCVKYLDLWRNELDSEVFVYDMSELSSHMKMSPPRIEEFMEYLNQHGRAAKSHVCPTSFKTDIPLEELKPLYRDFSPDAGRQRCRAVLKTFKEHPLIDTRRCPKMPSVAIIGAQWGDEGKGKITDYLDEKADLIVRFQGGNNAGHTIVVDDKVFKLHGLPSGVVRPGKLAVIGNGVVLNLDDLKEEIDQVLSAGGSIDGLRISDRAHLIMGYHKKLDGAEEKYRGKNNVGTTKKGIGPTYQDKIARIGFRAGDLLEEDLLKEKISFVLPYKKDLMDMMDAEKCSCTTESLFDKMCGWRDMIGKCICDTSVLINDSLDQGKNVVFEGAQGAMLDIDHGTYPYVTSSATCGGGICTGSGVAPGRIDKVVGVVKAYTTRVGEGPFVSELKNEMGVELQKKGGEFGVTTGRGRRCGWLDLVVAEHATRLCGFTSLTLTKLDVLNDIPELPVCVAYEIDGEEVKHFPASIAKLERAKPVYENFKGWKSWKDTAALVKGGYDELPGEMRDYIAFIEKYLKVPADLISIGPDRDETIDRKGDWWS